MSPRVRLVCHPRTDGAFSAHTAVHLKIDMPDRFSPEDVAGKVQARLRGMYPMAVIRVEEAVAAGGMSTWHVYRDGAHSNH